MKRILLITVIAALSAAAYDPAQARASSPLDIALTMDRIQYPGIGGWTYGALYLYHGYPKNGERETYEYSTGVDSE